MRISQAIIDIEGDGLRNDKSGEAGMSDTRFDGTLAQLTKLREEFVEVREKTLNHDSESVKIGAGGLAHN